MKALTFKGNAQVEISTVPDPILEAPGDVVVRNRVSAICGSDLHVYLGRERGIEPGTIMGHEFVGEVVEVGQPLKNVEWYRNGER